jgi:hypothetical protein
MSELAEWQAGARDWLRSHTQPRDGAADGAAGGAAGGVGLGSVAVFDNLTFEQEQEQLAAAALGELIARTDPAQARHRGLTAFLVPMDAPGSRSARSGR